MKSLLLLYLFLHNATWFTGKPSANAFLCFLLKLFRWISFDLNDSPSTVSDKEANWPTCFFSHYLTFIISLTLDSSRHSTNGQRILPMFNLLILCSSINVVYDSLSEEPSLIWFIAILCDTDVIKCLSTSPCSFLISWHTWHATIFLDSATEWFTQCLSMIF